MEQKVLIRCFEKSGEIWATSATRNKKEWEVPLVCGGSGYGKTRFALQTKDILLGHEFRNTKLASAVRNAEQFIFPLKHNGNQLQAVDTALGPSIYLGLRLLHGRTYPNVSWKGFSDEFLKVVPQPDEMTFGLQNVLRTFPVLSKQQALILIIDEFQESASHVVRYFGTSKRGKAGSEPFSNALYRQLMETMSTGEPQRLFVFPIFVGTGLSSEDIVITPSDYNGPTSIPIPGFSKQNTYALVKNHFKNGAQLLQDDQFLRLLAMVGGVGRPLERLKVLLDTYQPVEGWSAILRDLKSELKKRYDQMSIWTHYSGAFCLLFQGSPVTSKYTIPRSIKDKGRPIEMELFLKKGLVNTHTLKGPSRGFSPSKFYLLNSQSDASNEYFLMSAPLVYLSLGYSPHWRLPSKEIRDITRAMLNGLSMFKFDFLRFEDYAVWQFFLHYLVSSWEASTFQTKYLLGSQVLFGVKPQQEGQETPEIFKKMFKAASSKGVLLLESYHKTWVTEPAVTDGLPFVYPTTGQPIDLMDTNIPYVAIRLGGSSSFDGVLMLRDFDQPLNRTFFWIEVSHVGNADDPRVCLEKTKNFIAKSKAGLGGIDKHYIVAGVKTVLC